MLTVDVCFYDPKRENYLLVIQTLLLLTCLLQKDTNQLKGVLVFLEFTVHRGLPVAPA